MTSRDEEERQVEQTTPPHRPPDPGGLEPYGGGTPARTSGGGDLQSDQIIAIIAALIPGLGQLLLGQTVKGLVLLGVALITCSGLGLFSVASVVDAYLVAKAQQNREVGEWEFFPDYREAFNM
jgi:TM2 domain-containing membrane protein YozV